MKTSSIKGGKKEGAAAAVPSRLSLDIETFSSVDLAKAGVYRYAESADFQVLLIGWSMDGGPVSVADLASGAAMPPEEEIDFVLDRPFAFIITGLDGLPLFAGTVWDIG